jgi:hypothetical protein
MKPVLLALMAAAFLLMSSREGRAQVYDVYYYWDGSEYQQYWPDYQLYNYGSASPYPEQLYDPYYELHVVHYQLYLPQNQFYSYPCCFPVAVGVPFAAARLNGVPRRAVVASGPAAGNALRRTGMVPFPNTMMRFPNTMVRR